MPTKNRIVSLGYKKGTVVSEEGEVLVPPADWVYLAAGDGPLIGRSGGIWGAGTPDIRLLSPTGYESRENSPQFRCTPSRAPAGASSDGPEIVRVCAPGNR